MRQVSITALILLTAVGAQAVAPQPRQKDEKVERSPHAEALELVFRTQADKIRAVDVGDWWHDCKERSWVVKRPFHPGTIDSTHLFEVSYRIDGKEAVRWLVETGRNTVQERKPEAKPAP